MKTQRTARFLQAVLLLLTLSFLAQPATAQVCPFTVNLSSITPASCNGTNGSIRILTPTGGQSPYTYSWNTVPARTSQNLLSVAPGTYTLKVTDRRGCIVTRVWTVTNTPDIEAPTILCSPTPITVFTEPGLCGAFINFQDNMPIDYRMGGSATGSEADVKSKGPAAGADAAPARDVLKPLISDNCNLVTISGVRLDGQPMSAMYPLGNTSILWTATDAAGNTSQCTQVYTIIDNEFPVITGVPANITLDAQAQNCGRIVTWTAPTASDNCSAIINANWGPGSYFNVGTQTVTYTAADPSGNVTTRSFTVTIRDVEKPIILTCAPDTTVAAGPDCQALPVLPLPVATDNCPSSQLTFSNDAPATFLTGTTVVTWTVRDSSGNSATCQQRVTVADQSAPVPVLAALPDVTGICVATVTPPTASDCSGIITATTADATTYTTQGTHIVHWTFTDASGNSFVQLQNVILRDEEPPTIVCPRNIIAVADAPCGRSLDPGTATGTDNCTVTITGVRNDGRALGDCYPVGTTLVTWTAVDGAGNRASCEQTIVVTPIAISGTVYNDANAGTIDGTPISYAGGQLYVNLVNTVTNTVVASKVLTNGTFTFVAADGLQAGISTYALVLASSATATAAGLPDAAEWVNTAEGAAASTGDGNVNGTFSFGGAVVNGQVIDFGIEARPVPATLNVAPSQVNPGGNIEVTMDPALFAATDIRDLNGAGELRYLHILSFPTNSTSVSFAAAATTAGGPASAVTYTAASFPAAGVYVAANLSGNPLAAIAADPVDGAVSMDFAYKAIDQAGVESNNSGIARQPLTELWIAGTVYNDVDAMKDGAVDGTPVASAEGQPLYVNLMNTSNGAVVASRQVDNNGKYRFTSADGLRSDVATYRLVLTTAPANNWASLPAPAAWWNTGSGSSNGNGPTVNPVAGPNSGQFNFGGPIANGQIIDFGIEARPVPTPLTVAPAQQNPGGTNTVAIAAALFSATDAADISGGEVRFLHILSFPTNTNTVFFAASATSLNGVAGAQNYTAANFPAGGVYVATNAAGNPTSAISVDPVNGAVTIDFVYNAIDQADAESTTSGIARQPLTDLAISGTVYNDANGLTDALINGTPISDASGQLYVNLVDAASNTVVASKSLANGTFSFSTADGLSATVTGYKLVLTSSAAGISAALPDAALWVNTGEGASATSGDGTVNGTYGFAAAVTNGQVIDFGIEARPVPAALTVASSQPNPGGTNLVAIAATLFAATDATDLNNDGKVRYIHIVSFPTNTTTVKFAAASTTLGGASSALTLSAANFPSGGVYIATNTAGNPLSAISVDPVNGNVNIDFFYKAVDQANVESNTSGIARQPLTELVITGRVYDDADGATDGVIDGTPIAAPSAQQLYVNLVDAATGNVMAVRSVTTNNPGFSFGSAAGVTASGMYQLVLSSTAGTVGATALAAVLPSGWVNTGEGTPATIGDGTANGLYTFAAPVTTNTSIDFGIEARPVPTPLTVAPAQVNPGGNNTVAIAASLFSASDASDLNNTGMVKYLHITGFPSNTTSISFTSAATSVGGNYNAVSYTAANFPAGGIYLVADASGAPTAAISVDPTDGSVTIDIPYTAIDQALVESNTTGIARQPLGDLMISGTVYNDANALNDALINGTPISNAGGPLFVNLVRGNTVIATKALTNGTFSFGTADGLSASVANYKLVLAKSATGSVAALPDATNWVNTGEGNSGTSGDGSVDGSFTFSAVVSNGQVIDFGIEARPVPATLNVAPSQVNPGGTANISIAPTLFAATDASDLNNAGLVQYIWITSFPTNTTTVNFSGAATTPGGMTNILSYTAATFPAGGVYIATNSAGNPTTGITVDPVDGTVNVDFTYKAIDQAKVVSNNSGIARQPLTCPAPLITCPEAVTVSNTSNKCGASVNLSAPAASSQCGISSVNGVRNDGQAMNAMFPIGTTTITWTATASNGATVSCTQTVKVNDTQLPTISCGAAITANAVANDCKALVSVAAPTATDNCNVTVAGVRSDALALTAAYPVGTTTITWTATDASGNSASCTQTVTVKDVTAPTLTTPANITSCDNGSGNNKILVASATDNCTTVAITWTLTGATAGSGSGNTVSNNFNVGVTTINWTAKDGANNTITGTTTVTISAIPTATITVTTQDSLCLNTVLTASGGTSFQWVNGGSTVSTGQTLSLPLANCSGTLPFAPTSAARNFNVFVSGAVTATAGDTHGPVAMGGDLYLSGQTIFTMNTTGSYPTGSMNDANNYGMVIGGSVKYSLGNQSMINQGYLRIGNSTGSQIWYTDNNNAATNLKLTATGAGFNGNPSLMLQRPQATGTATQTHGLDFAGAFNTFTTESNRISNWSSTNASFLNKITIASGPNPHVMLVDNKINYIDLTVAQLNNLFNQGSIIFDNTPNANRTLVINVLASGTINWLPANFGGLSESDAAYIIWNFNGNCILNVNGSNPIYGTLLAPGAAVTKNNNNNFNGQIVAQALRVGSGEIHYYPFTSNLGYPGCSNTFQLYVTNSAGCSSSVSASYTYVAPLNTEKYTIVGLDAVTLADNNYVQSGGVGVNNNGGTATVQGSSSINGNGTFLKAPVLSVASTANVPTRYTTRANYVLPAMQYYTGTYTTGTYTVNQNQTVTLSANYGDLYISRGANVTLTGSTFKSVTIEETAKVTFTAATINLQKLIVGNNVLSGSAIANFNSGASVRISSQMTVGMKSIVNQANNRVYFYLGNDAIADKVIVKGGGAVVNGVVLAPTGNIKVGTDAQNPTVMNATATNCTQTNGCVPVTYNGWTKNYDGTYTFKYTVSNSCKNGISFYAFELKNGSSALSWSSGGGYTWEIENGTNNPYRSIKFQHPSPTMSQNSPSDVLYYTVSASDFNAMPTIRVTVHYGNNPTVQYTFNRDGCGTTIMPPPCTNTTMTGLFIGKTVTGDKCTYWNTMCGNNVQSRIAPAYVYQQPASTVVSEAAKAVQSEIKLPTSVIAFPNPSNGSFSLRLRGLSAGAVQVQVLNASGAVVAARQLTYGGKDESLPFQLGAVPAGLYTVRVTGRDGSLSTRIMIAR